MEERGKNGADMWTEIIKLLFYFEHMGHYNVGMCSPSYFE